MSDMLTTPLAPPALRRTWQGREPGEAIVQRAVDLPGVVGLPIRAIDPDLPEPLYAFDPAFGSTDLDLVRERTQERLRQVDFSRIRRGETVNLLANPLGFSLCNLAYVAMLEETQRYVRETTGADVRLRIAESMGHIENTDFMTVYSLRDRFGDAEEVPQIGRGVEIDTKIGRFWLMRDLFNADHIIHTQVSEMREGKLHRMVDRLFKPFGMSYTRIETRSAYHFGYGPRTGQIVSRAVFESSFVQDRYRATIVLDTSPEGVIDVDADNDLDALNGRITKNVLRNYGTLMKLLAEIDATNVVFDGPGCFIYAYGGGMTMDTLLYATEDILNLDRLNLQGFTATRPPDKNMLLRSNPAVKSFVINYMPGGVPFGYNAYVPFFIVDGPAAHWLANDPCNPAFRDKAKVVADLSTAVAEARAVSGTDNLLIYDSTPGELHVSEQLGQRLLERAPAVAAEVRERHLPMWLAQRNLA